MGIVQSQLMWIFYVIKSEDYVEKILVLDCIMYDWLNVPFEKTNGETKDGGTDETIRFRNTVKWKTRQILVWFNKEVV